MDKIERGKIIVFEGIDGCGKTVQLAQLKDRLEAAGLPTFSMDFPRYNAFFGRHVGRMLVGDYNPKGAPDLTVNDFHPIVTAPMYAIDRFHAKPEIEAALARGEWPLFNRYVSANMHQAAKGETQADREAIIDFFETLEYGLFGMPREDAVIFLRVDPEFALNVNKVRKPRAYMNGKKDMAESNLAHLQAAAEVYHSVARSRAHWVEIESMNGAHDGLRPPEEIHEEVICALKRIHILPDSFR